MMTGVIWSAGPQAKLCLGAVRRMAQWLALKTAGRPQCRAGAVRGLPAFCETWQRDTIPALVTI